MLSWVQGTGDIRIMQLQTTIIGQAASTINREEKNSNRCMTIICTLFRAGTGIIAELQKESVN